MKGHSAGSIEDAFNEAFPEKTEAEQFPQEPLLMRKLQSMDIAEVLKRVITDVAPLYEGEFVLREWLVHNGIIYSTQPGYSYRFIDNRKGKEGARIQDKFTTFAQALDFMLDFVKKNIEAEAVAKYIAEQANSKAE